MKEHTKFILLKAYWEYEVSRQDVIEMFGIAVAQAANYFAEVNKKCPGGITYDGSLKRYVPDYRIEEYLPSKDFQKYLNVVKSGKSSTFSIMPNKPFMPVALYRLLRKAIDDGLAIQFRYHSLNSISKKKVRTVYPHSLIDSGYRWHLRGWEQESNTFKDFNLSRIVIESVGLIKTTNELASIENDQAWNEEIVVFLIANPVLSGAERDVVSMDFNMSDGILNLFCKKALLLYTLNSYLVTDFSKKPPRTQLLAIGNHESISEFLPNIQSK